MVDKGLVDSCSFVIIMGAVVCVCAFVCVFEVGGGIIQRSLFSRLLYSSDFQGSRFRTVVEKGKLSAVECLLQYRWS